MNNKLKFIYLVAILPVFLLSACEKDGTYVMPTIKSINNTFDISGFVLGDTIEQYFDGKKMREYYGRVRTTGAINQLAFEKDEINMELKRKSTGQIVYQQKFNINDQESKAIKIYFDGSKLSNQYSYPSPQGNDYTVNFYLDPSSGKDPVDIMVDVLEYYYDDTKPDPIVVVNTTSFPVAQNVQPGTWTSYAKIPVPTVTPTQSGTELYPIAVVRNAKTKEYYINKNRDQSTITVELPYDGVSPGKVQSIFLAKKAVAPATDFLEQYELIQLFPR